MACVGGAMGSMGPTHHGGQQRPGDASIPVEVLRELLRAQGVTCEGCRTREEWLEAASPGTLKQEDPQDLRDRLFLEDTLAKARNVGVKVDGPDSEEVLARLRRLAEMRLKLKDEL